MEFTQIELNVTEQAVTDAKDAATKELVSLELALVGGGFTNVIFA